ncbi:MAG: electron transfer flavoprotein subunit beta/FixA family protein [Elusimicrobia bacterium]|nr:electron transfer flavoprotein subunit beta/FixA family protein [Elusimicrobiota bacterium]
MTMKTPSRRYIVCLKPVPDPSRFDKLRLDPETMLLRRGDVPQVVNPGDRHAIEAAVDLKKRFGGTIACLTMAPPDAREQLEEALAMGCDRACLLTDRAFAGADTLATARALAAAVRKLGRFDLILCGCYSADGSTGQVGPQLAELLGIPDLTHALSLRLQGRRLQARCGLQDGTAALEAGLPALVSLDPRANVPPLPPMRGISGALAKKIPAWSAADLGLAPAEVGLAGSPTRMLNVFTPAAGRKGEILQGSANEVAAQLLEKLRGEKILPARGGKGSS